MKIIHVCQRDDLSTGGALRIAFDLVTEQIKQGFDVKILFLYGCKGVIGQKIPENSCYLNINDSKELLWKGLRFSKFLHKHLPDIVHHHDMLSWPLLSHLFFKRYKIIYHAHLDFPGIYNDLLFKEKLSWYLAKKIVDKFICLSNWALEQFVTYKFPRTKLFVIPNGINYFNLQTSKNYRDNFITRHNFNKNTCILGWAGRLNIKMKGTDTFIKTLKQLPNNFIGIIVGTGEDKHKLVNLSKELNLNNRIFFLNHLDKMNYFYNLIDYYMFTSNFEPFGLVVIESLLTGNPVFAFPCKGGVNEIFSLNNSIKVLPNRNITESSIIIKSFCENKIFKNELKLNMTQLQNYYSIERMARKVKKLYRLLIY